MSLSRRQFVQGAGVAGLGLLAGCGRLPGQAPADSRRSETIYRVGHLTGNAGPALDVFRDALGELGYVEGKNLILETRLSGTAESAETPVQARELVDLHVDVIVTSITPAAYFARDATRTIPIVNQGIFGGDLLEAGLAESLARPGGNVTGLTTFETDLVGKRLQLLAEVAPQGAPVGVLWAGGRFAFPRDLYTRTAEQLGVPLQLVEVGSAEELDDAFESMRREHVQALEVRTAPLVNQYQARIVDLALRHRLPTMTDFKGLAIRGLLMAYVPQVGALVRRSATYVDRIFKGAHPAELPIERPTVFDFVINLKTAQAIGLTIPQHVLLQATEVVQCC